MELTEERLKRETGEYDLDVMNIVRVPRAGLADVGVLALCTHLVEVDLGENELVSLAPLASLASLEVVRAPHNRISSCAGLESLPALRLLDLRANRLASVDDLVAALRGSPGLRSLHLRGPNGEESNPGAEFADARAADGDQRRARLRPLTLHACRSLLGLRLRRPRAGGRARPRRIRRRAHTAPNCSAAGGARCGFQRPRRGAPAAAMARR